ncbi:TorF family putative porin [Acinetobacter terrae]|uniref:Porin n=1 Tax=Acinetobacter terrae TaxID=2731247 RepID=A0ABX1V0C9_9GAMM|nr:TorF family putative porin [Acinetobacter terrae]NNH87070.1 hypothetical protein [Acinetobacter terrae]
MKLTLKALSLAVLGAASTFTFAEEAPASEHTISGNIGVVSQYVLRGNTASLENSGAAVQGGLDYSHSSGFYAGYWGSTLDVSYAESGEQSFEHDFYAGFNGSITEDLGYTIGGIYYVYYPSDDSNVFETLLGLNYKDFSFTAQTLTDDVIWGNAGDTYFLASYSYPLPKDFTLNTSLGAYYYSDSGDFEEALGTTEDFNFRHLTAGLSHPLGDTGASVSMDYIIGGKLRDDTDLKNKVVLGLKYGF